jgi:hypothetical protein
VYGSSAVAAVVPVLDTAKLERPAAEVAALTQELEDVLDWYAHRLPPTGHEGGGQGQDAERGWQQQQQGWSAARGAMQHRGSTGGRQLRRKQVRLI